MVEVIHGRGKPLIVDNNFSRYGVAVTNYSEGNKICIGYSIPTEFQHYTNGYYLEVQDKLGRMICGKSMGLVAEDPSSFYVKWFTYSESDFSFGENAPLHFYGYAYELPYCYSLVESFEADGITKKLASGEIRIRRKGWYYSSVLDYSKYSSPALMKLLGGILNTKGTMLFFPRCDQSLIRYEVKIPSDFRFKFQQAAFHSGHKLPQLSLSGVKRIEDIDLSTSIIFKQDGEGVGFGDYFGSID